MGLALIAAHLTIYLDFQLKKTAKNAKSARNVINAINAINAIHAINRGHFSVLCFSGRSRLLVLL